ncbi:MAG: GNAT family protein [Flavobacteriales bacterium]
MEFKLRPWEIEDLSSLVKYANNPRIAANLTDGFPYPYTEENGRVFLERFTTASPTNVMCIEVNGEAAGAIGLHAQGDIMRKSMEMGYWLAEPYWGNGIITKAIAQMVDYGFQTFDVNRIFARPYGRNVASQRVLEKAGLKKEGHLRDAAFKNGEYDDLLVYGVIRSDIDN